MVSWIYSCGYTSASSSSLSMPSTRISGPSLAGTRVSTEVTFWHSAEYGSDFRLNSGEIPRNSAEFRGISPELSRNHFRSQKIPRNSVSAEFRGHPSWNIYIGSLEQPLWQAAVAVSAAWGSILCWKQQLSESGGSLFISSLYCNSSLS